MRRHFGKKRVILVGLVALAIGIGTAAFAYFTSKGTGSAAVGTSTPWEVWTDAAFGGPMVPGGKNSTHEQIGWHVRNNGSGYQYLAKLNIEVASSDGSVWSSQTDAGKPACTGADFELTVDGGTTWHAGDVGVDDTSGGNIAPGQGVAHSFQIRMIDSGGNQDNCQNLAVPLYLYAS